MNKGQKIALASLLLTIFTLLTRLEDIIFLLFNLLFALSTWLGEYVYMMLLKGYIIFLLALIITKLIYKWRGERRT